MRQHPVFRSRNPCQRCGGVIRYAVSRQCVRCRERRAERERAKEKPSVPQGPECAVCATTAKRLNGDCLHCHLQRQIAERERYRRMRITVSLAEYHRIITHLDFRGENYE